MKKKLTIPLLLLVLLIWGCIFYKVILATDETMPLPAASAKPALQKRAEAATAGINDYQPKGGYRDPFLTDEEAVEEEEAVEMVQPMENAVPPPEEAAVDWSAIQYLGEVSNAQRKVALFRLGEKDFMLKEGETREGLTLVQLSNEYIKIRYQEKENIIAKK